MGSPRRRRGGGGAGASGRGGARGTAGELQREGSRAAWSLGVTRGRPPQEWGGRGPPRWRAALCTGSAEAEREVGDERWTFLPFQKIPWTLL